MNFASATVRSVKADIAAGSISVTFTVALNDLDTAEELAKYVGKDASDMKIAITPRQMGLFASKAEQS